MKDQGLMKGTLPADRKAHFENTSGQPFGSFEIKVMIHSPNYLGLTLTLKNIIH